MAKGEAAPLGIRILKLTLKKSVFLTTALAGVTLVGYGRRAYAACISGVGFRTYICSGATSVRQSIIADSAHVTAASNFFLEPIGSSPYSLEIYGAGAISLTLDSGAILSSQNSQGTVLDVQSSRNYLGNGTVTVTGDLTIMRDLSLGQDNKYGAYFKNQGDGDTTIQVTANISSGDRALTVVQGSGSTGSVDLALSGAGAIVSQTSSAMFVNNDSTGGSTTIAVDGYMYIAGERGIYAKNGLFAADINITTGYNSSIQTSGPGIAAANYGSGAINIVSGGDIYAGYNGNTARQAILVTNYRGTSTTVTVNGDALSVGGAGVDVINYSYAIGDVSVTTGASSLVSGIDYGISVENRGSGDVMISAVGDVHQIAGIYGAYGVGILAKNGAIGGDINVATGNVVSNGVGVNSGGVVAVN